MAFDFSLTVDLFKHRFLAANRAMRKLPVDCFVEKQNRELAQLAAGQKLMALPSVCHICGYSMAELILDNDWSIRACSATGFKHILNNPNANAWQKSVGDEKVFLRGK